MALVGVLTTILSGNNAPLMASLAQSEAAMKGYATGTTTATTVASKAFLGLGIAAAVGVVASINAAADFEDAMTGVRKTVDETDLTAAGMTFEGLGMTFRQMATELPVAASELAAIGETAGALGIKAGDIEAFTRTIAMLGITTDLSTSQAAESLGRVGVILGLTGNEWTAYADTLVNLGNKGSSTESQIQGVVERFAGAGMQAGLSTPQILAFSAAIANVVADPEAAGSSLSRLFGGMILGAANGTKAGMAFAKTTGMAFKDWSNLVRTDTVGAMLVLLESLQGLDAFGQQQALSAMGIGNVRDINAIRLLAATYETNLVPAIEHAMNSAGAQATEVEKRLQALNPQLTLLANSFTELAISAGTPLLPPITDFVKDVSGVVLGISQWTEANPGFGASLMALVPALIAVGIGIALLGGPITLIVAGLVLLIANMDNLVAGAQEVKRLVGATGEAELFRARFQMEHGRMPSPVEFGQFQAGTLPPQWGELNTPGFHAGEVGSPYTPQPGGWRTAQRPGGPAPITLNHHSDVYLDGTKVGEVVERKLYNDASAWNSGFSNPGSNPNR